MLRIYNEQADLWDIVLPENLREMPKELGVIDEILSDEKFTKRFEEKLQEKIEAKKFSANFGRPSTFIATYVRLMYLKFRHQYSYEEVIETVNDSVGKRKFCGIGLSEKMPDDTTLIKLTAKLGEDFISGLVEETAKEAMRRGLTKGKKLRVDTFVMKSNIHYPTDATLLSDGIRVVTRLVGKLREAVGKRIRERMPDYVRKAKRILLKLHFHRKGKKEGGKGKTEELIGELMKMAEKTVQRAETIGKKLRGAVEGHAKTTQKKLKEYLALTRQVMDQTRRVLAGCKQIPDRVVSLFDKGARPIVKGKSFPEVEFGRKVVIAESEAGIITHAQGYEGNPNDQTLLEDAIKAQKDVLGETPESVATDRGFYDSSGKSEARLKAAGIRNISIPARGYKDGKRKRKEESKIFRKLQRWRAGQEAKISHLMRTFGVGKSLMRGTEGASVWLLYSVFAYNLWQMARLLTEKNGG